MVKCDFCDGDVDYLPFQCRYCGKNFCKTHRLPENHECTFEFKNNPYVVKKISPQVQTNYSDYTEDIAKEQEGFNRWARRGRRSSMGAGSMFNPFGPKKTRTATYTLMGLQLVFLILSYIPVIAPHLYLSVEGLSQFWFHTIITSIFTPNDILDLIFNLIFIYFLGRLIEGRFDSKVFFELYVVSGLIAGAFALLIQLLFSFIPGYSGITAVPMSLVSGAMVGLIAFMTLMLPDTKIRLFMMFIPISLRTRNLLWFFVGFYVIFGVISLFTGYTIGFIINIASIAGAMGGYIKIKALRQENQWR